jgi:hypothetical protein
MARCVVIRDIVRQAWESDAHAVLLSIPATLLGILVVWLLLVRGDRRRDTGVTASAPLELAQLRLRDPELVLDLGMPLHVAMVAPPARPDLLELAPQLVDRVLAVDARVERVGIGLGHRSPSARVPGSWARR